MSLAFVASRAHRAWAADSPAGARERSVRRRLAVVWGLLVLNALPFYAGMPLVLPIPHVAGQMITQGALVLALLVALTVNRRIIVRPNVFLFVMSLLVIGALVALPTWPLGHRFGTVYRTFRLAEFIAVLWLLTPWWGRRDLLFLRYHLTTFGVLLCSVLLGLALRPGAAMGGGRLSDVVWPVPTTEVAHYAAVIIGLVVVLWFGGVLSGGVTLLVAAIAVPMLILTHTRTALGAMAAGLIVAGLSLVPVSGRARKFFVAVGVVVSIAVTIAASLLTTWLARGENAKGLASLTGRTNFWRLVVNLPRDRFQMIFGFGLANSSVNGLPIDSNWLAAYMQQGLFGVFVCAAALLFLILAAFFHPLGIRRALAIFLIIYTLVASVTQVGFIDATTYLLGLAVAASLLVNPGTKGNLDESAPHLKTRITWLANRRASAWRMDS